MKQSQIMTLLGYQGLPNGPKMIQEQQEREGLKEPSSEVTFFGQNDLKPVLTPKFTPALNYDQLHPFDCIKGDDEHFGTYVIRDDTDLEVIVEVQGWTQGNDIEQGGPIFGNAWTVDGRSVDLAPEEEERIADEWRDVMEARVKKEERIAAHDADL